MSTIVIGGVITFTLLVLPALYRLAHKENEEFKKEQKISIYQ